MVNRKKIKIAFGLNGLNVGGMEKQFIQQMRCFNKNKYDISLITLFQFSTQHELYGDLPKNISVYKLEFSSIFSFFQWLKLLRVLLEIKPDIVVSSLFFSNTVFRILKPFFGYVSIAREHNTYKNKSFFHCHIDYVLSFWTYKIVAVSNTVAHFTSKQEKIPLDKFVVINNGINLKEIENITSSLPNKTDLRKSKGFSGGDLIFLNVARLVPQKNHRLLLEAFSLLSDDIKNNIKLIIVGDGILKKDLEDLVVTKNLSSFVSFVGFTEDVWSFYRLSDIFISTSKIEGFSNAYLEAMACGLPVLSTRTAGSDELIIDGKNGHFIDFEAKNISNQISTLTEEKISKMGYQSKLLVKKYDINFTVDKYEKLFDEALHI